MAQDEWLHVFILFLMVLEIKPRTSGMLHKCSTTEPLPQLPPTSGGRLVRGSTTAPHPSPLLGSCRQGLLVVGYRVLMYQSLASQEPLFPLF